MFIVNKFKIVLGFAISFFLGFVYILGKKRGKEIEKYENDQQVFLLTKEMAEAAHNKPKNKDELLERLRNGL